MEFTWITNWIVYNPWSKCIRNKVTISVNAIFSCFYAGFNSPKVDLCLGNFSALSMSVTPFCKNKFLKSNYINWKSFQWLCLLTSTGSFANIAVLTRSRGINGTIGQAFTFIRVPASLRKIEELTVTHAVTFFKTFISCLNFPSVQRQRVGTMAMGKAHWNIILACKSKKIVCLQSEIAITEKLVILENSDTASISIIANLVLF